MNFRQNFSHIFFAISEKKLQPRLFITYPKAYAKETLFMDLLLNSHNISITVKNSCFAELVDSINISYPPPPPPPPQKKCAFKSTCVLRTKVQLDWSSAH